MWLLLAVACQDDPPISHPSFSHGGPTVTPSPTATSPSPTCVLDPAPSGGELFIADADVTLPDGVIAAGGTRRLPDLGGDGRDDLAAGSANWDTEAVDPTLVHSFTIWTDVTNDASTLDITSPTTSFDDYTYDYNVGVIALEATSDVASDGTPD